MKQYISKQNRALLAELVRTDFKLRYQGSVLGYAWSLLKPLLMFAILYIVFAKFLKIGSDLPHYPIYLLFGVVLWNFFSEMTTQSVSSIVGRGDLIRKIRIPRWMIVFSSSISALINLGLNLVVVVLFVVLNKVDITHTVLWLPLNIVEIYVFALGASLILATAFVKFRDISYIWDVFIQAGFYLTPIFYPLSLITKELFQKLLLMNPMGQAIQDARYNAITHETITTNTLFHGGPYMYIPYAIVMITLVLGVFYFKKESKFFAENI